MKRKTGYYLYEGNIPTARVELEGTGNAVCGVSEDADGVVFRVFRPMKNAAFFCEFTFENWSKEGYLMIPAAVYAANRFRKKRFTYPPFLSREEGASPDMQPVLSDVPAFDEDGRTRIAITAADTACPCVGVYLPRERRAVLLFVPAQVLGSPVGITLSENLQTGLLIVRFTVPCVREGFKYAFGTTECPSDDRGIDFAAGESVRLALCCHPIDCPDIHTLYREFFRMRKVLSPRYARRESVALSEAFRIIENKYNTLNWAREGYYRVGTIDDIYQDWQAGWTGGGINTYPLLSRGCALSAQRAAQTLRFILTKAIQDSGFFKAVYYNGKFYGDNYDEISDGQILLIRKHCDALYFLLRQKIWDLSHGGKVFSDEMTQSLRAAADALLTLWKKCSSLGQFIDSRTVEIYAGGTASGAVAPAALALAAHIFSDQKYLMAACAIADDLTERCLHKGFINGGPGDMCQCADSESAFGLLESYIVLYEYTYDKKWLDFAEKAAWQCSAWCVSYDYVFPENSCFAARGVRTAGSVFANLQNKHAAPGVCTLSGDSLLKLYRYTSDERYMELLCDIASGITQYLSTEKEPVFDYRGERLPAGFMNERVNISDWEGKDCVGGVFNGSCWAEISCMLTYLEVPGVYIDLKNRRVFSIDPVRVSADADRFRIGNERDTAVEVCIAADDLRGVWKGNPAPVRIGAHSEIVIEGEKNEDVI